MAPRQGNRKLERQDTAKILCAEVDESFAFSGINGDFREVEEPRAPVAPAPPMSGESCSGPVDLSGASNGCRSVAELFQGGKSRYYRELQRIKLCIRWAPTLRDIYLWHRSRSRDTQFDIKCHQQCGFSSNCPTSLSLQLQILTRSLLQRVYRPA